MMVGHVNDLMGGMRLTLVNAGWTRACVQAGCGCCGCWHAPPAAQGLGVSQDVGAGYQLPDDRGSSRCGEGGPGLMSWQ